MAYKTSIEYFITAAEGNKTVYKTWNTVYAICDDIIENKTLGDTFYKLRDFNNSSIVVNKQQLKNAMILGKIVIINLRLSSDKKILKTKVVEVSSLDEINNILKSSNEHLFSGVIGNKDMGYYKIDRSYYLNDYMGYATRVELPRLASIDSTAFVYNDYAKELIIPSTYKSIYNECICGSRIEYVEFKHNYKEFMELGIHATYAPDLALLKDVNNINTGMFSDSRVTIGIFGEKLNTSDFKMLSETRRELSTIKRFDKSRDLEINEQIEKFGTKGQMLGKNDFKIDYYTNTLVEYKEKLNIYSLSDIDRNVIDKIEILKLPPVKYIRSRWLYIRTFADIDLDREIIIVDKLILPNTLDIEKLSVHMVPFTIIDNQVDTVDAKGRTKKTYCRYTKPVVREIILPEDTSVKNCDKGMGNIIITKGNISKKASELEVEQNTKTGLHVKIIEIFDYPRSGNIYYIEDSSNTGAKRKVYEEELIDVVVKGKVCIDNALVLFNGTIRLNK